MRSGELGDADYARLEAIDGTSVNELNERAWRQWQRPPVRPGGRIQHGLAYDSARGQTQLQTSCALRLCHGSDGDSGPAPDLSRVTPSKSNCDLARIVLNGTMRMPSFSHLSDQQIADLIAHARERFP